MVNNTDEYFMKLAIELAKKGMGKTAPNPIVGAVIVKNNELIGQGRHEEYGREHAEVNAISSCKSSPKGATIYVTLEPCCHYGKQPPCTLKIIEAGISRVVIGSFDPNPQVSGRGIKMLEDSGISVITGVLKEKCDVLNEVFFHYIKTKKPYVILKYAMTADGKISTHTGASKWITQESAREQVHRDRNKYSAIMVGVGTVIKDDPMLNCRLEGGNHPVRVICDTKLRTPLSSNVVRTAKEISTWIATASDDVEKQYEYEAYGCKILKLPKDGKHIDIVALMELLGKMQISSVIVEGGAEINWSVLKSGLVNKLQLYIGARLFGGMDAKSPIGGEGIDLPDDSLLMRLSDIRRFENDCLLEYEICKSKED